MTTASTHQCPVWRHDIRFEAALLWIESDFRIASAAVAFRVGNKPAARKNSPIWRIFSRLNRAESNDGIG